MFIEFESPEKEKLRSGLLDYDGPKWKRVQVTKFLPYKAAVLFPKTLSRRLKEWLLISQPVDPTLIAKLF